MENNNIYTVFGGSGFIGSHIVEYLERQGEICFSPERNDNSIFEKNLGTVIYAAGFGDCQQPQDVFYANTKLVADILKNSIFDKFIYISSTRVYMGQNNADELCDLTVLCNDSRRLFNLSKLMSEELCLKSNRNVVIVRPSNVYGMALNSPLFLPSIARNALKNNHIDMYVSPDYSKDYISVNDVVSLIYKISKKNKYPIYNLASGVNTKAIEIANIIQNKTGCTVKWHPGVVDDYFPETDINRVSSEYSHVFCNVLEDLSSLIDNMKNQILLN